MTTSKSLKLAEGTGFEPAKPLAELNGLANRRLAVRKTGWTPRNPRNSSHFGGARNTRRARTETVHPGTKVGTVASAMEARRVETPQAAPSRSDESATAKPGRHGEVA